MIRAAMTHRPAVAVLGSSTWMATVLNAPLWRELHALQLLQRPGGWALAFALAVVIGGALVALLSLMASRWTLKPALAVLLLAAAAGAYFMFAYRIVIDAGMLTNALHTDRREAAALASPWLLAALGLLGLAPAVAVWRMPLRYAPPLRQGLRNLGAAALALAAAVLAVALAFQPLASSMRNHKQLRYLLNPLNTVYALGQAAWQPLRRPTRLQPIGLDAAAPVAGDRPPLLLLVVGETARSGNFGLNGYGRDTTPRLARQGVVSWPNAWSCGTSTATALPCMFSHLGREAFGSRDNEYENLLDVLQRAGLAVLWLDNQGGCKGVCDRVPHASTTGQATAGLCDGESCLDGAMLDGLEGHLQALPAERRARGVVVVLHQMGSHGPAYAQRSPPAAKRFLPECRSVNLGDCAPGELLNAYDNSIAYTDAVLDGTIEWLKRQQAYDTALLYVSDHGESLGENNLYLHGMPYAIAPDVQKRVPWITWLSPRFSHRSGITHACLQGLGAAALSHDNYFHAALGLMQVRTALYERGLDPYAACAGH